MAKKKEENKKTKFIKILFTEEEFKDIGKYAQNSFQSKSEFVRVAIRERIDKIIKERYEIHELRSKAYEEFKKEFGDLSKNPAIELELKEILPLKTPDQEEMKKRKEEKEARKIELEELRKSFFGK